MGTEREPKQQQKLNPLWKKFIWNFPSRRNTEGTQTIKGGKWWSTENSNWKNHECKHFEEYEPDQQRRIH